MQIGILQCGHSPPDLIMAHGNYGAMVSRLVDSLGATHIFDVTQGELPAHAKACDAYLLTGSPAGVYDNLPWIPRLAEFLHAARGSAKLVGICFGHQMIAQTFGGQVLKAAQGWGIGVHRYDVLARTPWMDDSVTVSAPASHQDQVISCPPDARVLLASPFTPFAALDYGYAMSFQCHPEFTTAFGKALIEGRRSVYGDLADAAIASYDQGDDRARLASWIRAYLTARAIARAS